VAKIRPHKKAPRWGATEKQAEQYQRERDQKNRDFLLELASNLNVRGAHTATCASGARAETRGKCDCGAGEAPFRARLLKETDGRGHQLVELQVDGPLTTSEAVMLSIMLQDLTKEEGQRWARAKARRKKS